MTGQLLPLRLLSLSRGAFPSHLKTLTFSSAALFPPSSVRISTVRCFSSRPARLRDDGRSGFRSARVAAAGQGKSLIEDEAELSDWVGDLNTSSFKLGLSERESEDERRSVDRSSSKVRVRDSGGFSDRRSSRGSLSNRGSRGSNGFRNERGSVKFSERGSNSKRRFGSDFDDDEEERGEKREFLSEQRRRRGAGSSFGRKGGRSVESSYKQGRKSLRGVSSGEDEDTEDNESGFDDDFFGDKVDGKKGGEKGSLLKSVSSAELGDKGSKKPVSRSSGGDGNSYLSSTR